MSSATVPPAVREEVRAALEREAGRSSDIRSARTVGGGCINPSARIETEDGSVFFLKWNREHPELFDAEADGLRALASTETLRVPDVVATGSGGSSTPGWLLLEFVAEGRPGGEYGPRLGRELAELHAPLDEPWGWDHDNFIGSLPQRNDPRPTWAEFWAERRIEPQLRRARDAGLLDDRDGAWRRLLTRMDEWVGPAESEGPSLLHGDLWSGNVYPGPGGEPVVVDPAVYRGHREVDLAMTELFGGFPRGFREAYEDVRPVRPGYREVRRSLYQLYPLLVHVNLFGSGYVGRTEAALREVLRNG